jgi:hypothetical protein
MFDDSIYSSVPIFPDHGFWLAPSTNSMSEMTIKENGQVNVRSVAC